MQYNPHACLINMQVLARFDAFKEKANAQVDKSSRTEGIHGEFHEETEKFVAEWKRVIDVKLAERAKATGEQDPQALPKKFAIKHIDAIKELGYEVSGFSSILTISSLLGTCPLHAS